MIISARLGKAPGSLTHLHTKFLHQEEQKGAVKPKALTCQIWLCKTPSGQLQMFKMKHTGMVCVFSQISISTEQTWQSI